MKKQLNAADTYYLIIYNKILSIAPIVASCAAVTFSIAWLLGEYSFVKLKYLILFDAICISYFFMAYYFKNKGILINGLINYRNFKEVELLISILVIVQWNLISYIFPTESFWGFAPLFLLVVAFFLNSKTVIYEAIGLSLSIFLSWILLGDKLLPARNDMYYENLILRLVSIILTFFVIYLLTFITEKFTHQIKDHFNSIIKQNDELETLGRDIIDFTAGLIEERDKTSGVHVKRLKLYTKILATEVAEQCPEYYLNENMIEDISLASVLHDVGKIAIPDSILQKPGKLTQEEFNIIKSHTVLGAKIIDSLPDSIGEDYKRYCKEICQFHHEKFDGNGYPIGLKGDDIPISAQIVSVVDCYDALTNERPYKHALPKELAINMIINGDCGEFSEKMKKCLINCKNQLINT